jgi:hypothetical protein
MNNGHTIIRILILVSIERLEFCPRICFILIILAFWEFCDSFEIFTCWSIDSLECTALPVEFHSLISRLLWAILAHIEGWKSLINLVSLYTLSNNGIWSMSNGCCRSSTNGIIIYFNFYLGRLSNRSIISFSRESKWINSFLFRKKSNGLACLSVIWIFGVAAWLCHHTWNKWCNFVFSGRAV